MPADVKARIGESLLSDGNVWRAARLLIEVHGEAAPMAAAERVDRAAATHRSEAVQIWREVLLAVEETLRRKHGGQLH